MSFVHIILVNYNGHRDTIECLESVLKSTHLNFKVWVVDNSPTDESLNKIIEWASGSTQSIETKFPDWVLPPAAKPISYRVVSEHELTSHGEFAEALILVRAQSNKGFAAANNIALSFIQKSNSWRYAWILNNDTVVPPATLRELVSFMEKQPERIGMIGGKLMEYNSPELIQTIGCRYYRWFGKIVELGKNHLDSGQWDREDVKLDYVVGASIFLSRELLATVGLMEEKYFLYFEEIDWAIRSNRAGWQIGFCPSAKIYHKGGSTIKGNGGNSRMMDFYYARNRILLAKKFFPFTQPVLLISFGWFALRRILQGQFDRIPMLLKIIMKPNRFFGS